MISKQEARGKLVQALQFVESAERYRDFNLTWESPTSGVSADEEEHYETRRIRFSEDIHDDLQDIVKEKVENEVERAIHNEKKGFEQYDISNADKETTPLQFLDAEELPEFNRFRQIVTETDFEETSYSDAPNPDFQTIRIKNGTDPEIVVFQKFTRRQILGKSNKIKIPLTDDDSEYDKFKPNLMAIPERIDALYFEGLIYVVNPNKFEDIFDYVEEYETQANMVFSGLEESDINIHNYDEFYESVSGDRRALRKMHKVEQRGLYQDLQPDDVEDVVDEFELGIRTKTNQEGEWGIEIPDMRKKWDVIRILNDDHVLSYLTDDKFQIQGSKDER